MREIEKKLNMLDNEMAALRQARNDAAVAGKTEEENALSDKIDALTNDIVLLNDKAMQLLDSSEGMQTVIDRFKKMESDIQEETKNLEKYSASVKRATIVVQAVSDILQYV